jgi:hypothetical protein
MLKFAFSGLSDFSDDRQITVIFLDSLRNLIY